jgi:hypothetical protein
VSDKPWNPEVERIRKAMMERFSDKLSMEEIAEFAYSVAVECTAPAPQPAWFDHDWISKARQIKEGKTDLHRADLLKSIAEAYAAAATPQVTPELEPGKFLNTFCGIVPAGR